MPLEDRRGAFAAMADSVWLGPAIAIVFVATLWRALAMIATLLLAACTMAAPQATPAP